MFLLNLMLLLYLYVFNVFYLLFLMFFYLVFLCKFYLVFLSSYPFSEVCEGLLGTSTVLPKLPSEPLTPYYGSLHAQP